MKIVFIATYPPRECGIGTFTDNLFKSMLVNDESKKKGHVGFVVALNDNDLDYEYPEEVRLTVRQDQVEDYIQAADYINQSDAEICILEHEFGIFGGQDGVYILSLLHRLKIPFIVTLHTILKTPTYNQRAILLQICRMAHNIVVMNKKAIEFLVDIYQIPRTKIELYEHGVPDIRFDPEKVKKELKLDNKKILLTFGFIGRNKGIETVIKALPDVVDQYPETLYVVLGKTHPNVMRSSGEEYRQYLMKLVSDLKLEKNVLFINQFLDEQNLFKYLYACDIYITPYSNEAQITSGTLSYAVGVGAAVVSTPYWHASELLAEGRGRFIDFGDSKGLSTILTDLFNDPESFRKMKRKAYDYGLKITWPKTGQKYMNLVEHILKERPYFIKKNDAKMDLSILPPFSLNHVYRMTDDTGIIQHATFGIPNRKEGYCLDDNARALLMALMAYKQMNDERALELVPVYLSYILYLQNPDGTFRNFLSFNRSYLDEVGSEDSFGRTIWALGYLLGDAPNDAFFQAGSQIFYKAAPNFEKLKSIRAIANTMIGMSYYLKKCPFDDVMMERLRSLANIMADHFEENETPDWKWFESLLAYDNGILPLALLHASEILHDEKISKIAFVSMKFLTDNALNDDYLSLIGNENWYRKGGKRSVFAQQPIDAMAMVLMYQQAFRLTKDQEYLHKLYTSFMWFLGENELRMSLYDHETQGCCDGFEQYGVNRNQGAESTLAYLISYLTLLEAHNEFRE